MEIFIVNEISDQFDCGDVEGNIIGARHSYKEAMNLFKEREFELTDNVNHGYGFEIINNDQLGNGCNNPIVYRVDYQNKGCNLTLQIEKIELK